MDPWLYDAQLDTPESFPFFKAYRDAKNRNLRVTRLSAWDHGVRREATPADVARWYVTGKWKERVAAYDAHMDAVYQEERECLARQTAKDMETQHREILALQTEVVRNEWEKLASESAREDDAALKPASLRLVTDSLIKNGRLINGQATDRIDLGPDLSKLSDEELTAYTALLAKARGLG